MPTETPEPTNTPTSTPIPSYILSGTVFFDYNGNGRQDEGEPPIEGAAIAVSDLATTSGVDGSYLLESVPAGNQRIYVEGPSSTPATAFRYISLSLAAFQPVEKPIAVTVGSDTTLNIALMQGFLTLPIPNTEDCSVGTYYDHQVGPGAENWMGNGTITGDEHIGTDYRCPEGTSVIAAAPGKVEEVIWREGPTGGYTIVIGHGHSADGSIEYDTDYAHLMEVQVAVGDRVERGQLLGLSGGWGSYPHLHFGFFAFHRNSSGQATPLEGERDINVDPYRWVRAEDGVSYWTKSDDPQSFP